MGTSGFARIPDPSVGKANRDQYDAENPSQACVNNKSYKACEKKVKKKPKKCNPKKKKSRNDLFKICKLTCHEKSKYVQPACVFPLPSPPPPSPPPPPPPSPLPSLDYLEPSPSPSPSPSS